VRAETFGAVKLFTCAALTVCVVASAGATDDAGRQVFLKDATPSCAICHTLAEAGATGKIGPSLDELKPDVQRVTQAVKAGIGAMPPYPQLSEEQVQGLARYVARASGTTK